MKIVILVGIFDYRSDLGLVGYQPPVAPISTFTKSSQKISTHLLTVLIISAIVHVEQRKGNNKEAS